MKLSSNSRPKKITILGINTISSRLALNLLKANHDVTIVKSEEHPINYPFTPFFPSFHSNKSQENFKATSTFHSFLSQSDSPHHMNRMNFHYLSDRDINTKTESTPPFYCIDERLLLSDNLSEFLKHEGKVIVCNLKSNTFNKDIQTILDFRKSDLVLSTSDDKITTPFNIQSSSLLLKAYHMDVMARYRRIKERDTNQLEYFILPQLRTLISTPVVMSDGSRQQMELVIRHPDDFSQLSSSRHPFESEKEYWLNNWASMIRPFTESLKKMDQKFPFIDPYLEEDFHPNHFYIKKLFAPSSLPFGQLNNHLIFFIPQTPFNLRDLAKDAHEHHCVQFFTKLISRKEDIFNPEWMKKSHQSYKNKAYEMALTSFAVSNKLENLEEFSVGKSTRRFTHFIMKPSLLKDESLLYSDNHNSLNRDITSLANLELIKKFFLSKSLKINHENSSHLALAIHHDWNEIVEVLLESGANPNCKYYEGLPALHEAILHKSPQKLIKKMLEYGARVNELSNEKGFSITSTETPLHAAVRSYQSLSDLEIIKLLIEHKANFYILDHEGLFPLHTAIRKRLLEVIKLFIKNGMNLNAPSPTTGDTALHHAALTNDKEILRIILPHVDTTIKNRDGKTSEMVAHERYFQPHYDEVLTESKRIFHCQFFKPNSEKPGYVGHDRINNKFLDCM